MTIKSLVTQVRRLCEELGSGPRGTAQIFMTWDDDTEIAVVEIRNAPSKEHVKKVFDIFSNEIEVNLVGEVEDHPEYRGYGKARAKMTPDQRDHLASMFNMKGLL